MNIDLACADALWLEPVLVLAVGTALIPAAAWFSTRLIRSALWHRTIWQAAALGLTVLLAVELSGFSSGVVAVWRAGGAGTGAQATRGTPSPSPSSTTLPPYDGLDGRVRGGDLAGERGLDHGAALNSSSGQQREVRTRRLGLARTASAAATAAERSVPRQDHGIDPRRGAAALDSDMAAARSPANGNRTARPLRLWALGVVLLVARSLWARVLALSLGMRRSVPVIAPLRRQVDNLAHQLRIGRRVRVCHVHGLQAPVAWGVLRPTVALPTAFAEQFSAQQQEANLAASLVALGRRITGPTRLGWLSVRGIGFRSTLGRRVQRLLTLREKTWRAPHRGRLWMTRTAVTLALIMVVVVGTAWARSQAALTDGGSQMSVLRLSWNRSLVAAAALALLGPTPGDALADNGPAETATNQPADDSGFDVALRPADDDREQAAQREARPREDHQPRAGDELRLPSSGSGPREGGPRREQERKELEQHQKMLRELRERRAELARRVDEIRHQLEELDDANPDERRELEHALHETEQQMHALERHALKLGKERDRRVRPPVPGGRPYLDARTLEKEPLSRQLEKMRREIERLFKAGRHEAAERLVQVAQQIARELDHAVPPGPGSDRDRHPPMVEDVQRRLLHLRVAVENLHAAGMHEPAAELEREIERLEFERREIQLRERAGRNPNRLLEPREPHPPRNLEQVVHELSAQIQEMRQDMQRLHEQIERLTDQVHEKGRIQDDAADDDATDDDAADDDAADDDAADDDATDDDATDDDAADDDATDDDATDDDAADALDADRKDANHDEADGKDAVDTDDDANDEDADADEDDDEDDDADEDR